MRRNEHILSYKLIQHIYKTCKVATSGFLLGCQ